MLDAVDFKDENRVEEDEVLDRRDRREAESLMDRIRRVQDDIDTNPNAAFRNLDNGAEKRSLRRQLQAFEDQVPQVASEVRRIEREIADAKLELFRLKDAKAHPNSAANIVGTGPGGTVTEADRIKARARARMQARAAELAGRPVPASVDDDGAAARRLEAESTSIRADREKNEAMTRDVEESVREFTRSLEDSLKEENETSTREHERRRWEDALGVEDVIRDFIYDLQRGSRTAHIRKEEESRASAQEQRLRHEEPSAGVSRLSPSPSAGSAGSLPGSTHEDRVAAARERAQRRIAERMAAAGLKPHTDTSETLLQRQEREKREREERLRRAEEEDAKREQERQRRLAEEQRSTSNAPAKPVGKKPPPAPPSRRGRTDSAGQAEVKKAAEETVTAEQAAREQAIREEQQAQEEETNRLEMEAQKREEELLKEKEAQESRLRALEEQVKQGKIRKQEEKRRKEEAERLAKEKEAALAAQRAEIERAKERERQLQLELEGLDDEESSSDDEGPANITPEDSTPTQSQLLPTVTPAAPVSAPESEQAGRFEDTSSQAPTVSFSPETESKNPYFKITHQAADTQVASPPPAPQTNVTSPKADVHSTNPFHRLAQQESSKPAFTGSAPLERKSRARPEADDDWSAAGSELDSSDDDDDERPGGGSAKQLASILFVVDPSAGQPCYLSPGA
ncbi:hypothetical protein CNMCM6069_006139 [Aspergillus lentulus]|nr:hypothetical protein CNMCM6069_006139 [Aspergillus lentulus]